MSPPKRRFFWWTCSVYWHEKAEPINCDRSQIYRLCVLAAGTNNRYLHRFEVNEVFLLALWTEQWEIPQFSIQAYSISCFVLTDWASYPVGFHLNILYNHLRSFSIVQSYSGSLLWGGIVCRLRRGDPAESRRIFLYCFRT